MIAVGELVQVLDEQTALVDELIEVAERERAHLIAFEPHRIQACVEEKRALLERERALEERRQVALASVLDALGVSAEDAETVDDLAALLPSHGGELRESAARLRERVQALGAHHAINQEHTERALRWVNAYVGVLRGAAEPTPTNRYAPSGRTATGGTAPTVNRRA
ncbi:MAG: hypothetical protein AMXMBFR64_34740 [Myxococcales bacterium]